MKKHLLLLTSWLIIIIGFLVIIGWVFDVGILKSIIPGQLPMKFITAIVFILTGALIQAIKKTFENSEIARIIIPIFVLGILFIMGTLLVSPLMGFQSGLEQVFVRENPDALKTTSPGTPSVGTMVGFTLIALSGIMVIWIRTSLRRRISLWISGVVAFIGIVAVIGYIFNISTLYYYFPNISSAIALITATLFIFIGIAMIIFWRSVPQQTELSTPSETTHNRSKKYFYIASTLIALTIIISLLFFRATPSPTALYQGTIVIGTETWPGYLPLYVAREKGFFRDIGLDVDIKRYVGLRDLSKDYMAGNMQGIASPTLDAINETIQGIDHKIVLAVDYSNGSDAIVAHKDIKTMHEVRGKRVGYEPNTLEEFFIAWALQKNDMIFSDIVSVAGNTSETARMLHSGDIDVAVSHEPFLSQAVSSDNFHVIYSSRNAPGLITDVLTFRTDFIEAYPDTVQAILGAYFKAFDFWQENPNEAHQLLAKEFNETPESIARQMDSIAMFDKRDNADAFTFATGLQSLYGNLRKIGGFVLRHKNIGDVTQLNTDTLIESRFVRALR